MNKWYFRVDSIYLLQGKNEEMILIFLFIEFINYFQIFENEKVCFYYSLIAAKTINLFNRKFLVVLEIQKMLSNIDI